MKSIKAPGSLKDVTEDKVSIFLAGSIDQGKAVDWQTRLTNALKDEDITILNPRRDDWDSTWKEDISNDKFREQVEWELDAQDKATIIAMYFDGEQKSPITLLELGLYAGSGKVIVCCPKPYWKKGNVDIVATRHKLVQAKDMEQLIEIIKHVINKVK
jgi:hypothetical protein